MAISFRTALMGAGIQPSDDFKSMITNFITTNEVLLASHANRYLAETIELTSLPTDGGSYHPVGLIRSDKFSMDYHMETGKCVICFSSYVDQVTHYLKGLTKPSDKLKFQAVCGEHPYHFVVRHDGKIVVDTYFQIIKVVPNPIGDNCFVTMEERVKE